MKMLKVVEGDDAMDELVEQGRLEVLAHSGPVREEKIEPHDFMVVVTDPIGQPVHVTHNLESLTQAQREGRHLAERYRDGHIARVYEERGYWQVDRGKALFRRFDAIG